MSFKLYYKGADNTVYPMEFLPYDKGFKDDFALIMGEARHESFSREKGEWYYPLGLPPTPADPTYYFTSGTRGTEDSHIWNFILRIGGTVDFSNPDEVTVKAKYDGLLYLDSECTKTSGISVWVSNSIVAFKFSDITNNDYKVNQSSHQRCFDRFSINPKNYNHIRLEHSLGKLSYEDGFKGLSFRSPYSDSDDTSLNKFLRNIYNGEQKLWNDKNLMTSSPLLDPFNISFFGAGICMGYNMFPGTSPSINAQYNNYATFYTVMKGKPIVAVDEMKFGEMTYRPAVVYRPDMFTAWDDFTYDVSEASSLQTYDIPSGYNQVTIGDTNVWALPLGFVQIGSGYLDSYVNKDVLNAYKPSKYDGVFSAGKIGDDKTKNTFMAINGVDPYTAAIYNFMLCQAFPATNLSKTVSDIGDDEVSRFRYGKDEQLIPYIFTVTNIYWSSLSDWGNSLSNLESPYNNCTVCLAVIPQPNQFANLTGKEMLDYFYGGKADVWEPVEPTPSPDIPEDNGNGGFNNNDYLGGNGSWQDTTTDMSYDKNNPLWHTPDNLGLDGNYDIVKLNRASVEMLASQTWTQDGWLDYVSKMSNISRAGDGIVDFKTCFAEIPSTGEANIVAIAGFGLNQPIPCRRVNQYNQFDMGTVNVPVYFDSFLDYAPYTEIVLELPFAQPVQIPPEVVVGQNINLTLSVDLMSSTAMYIITCDGRLLAQVPANIFITLPFAASEFTQSALSSLSSYVANAGNIGGRVGASASAASMHGQNPVKAGGKAASRMLMSMPSTGLADIIGAGIQTASNVVNGISEAESTRNITQISQGGGGGAIGAMGLKYATLKITRPYVTIPPRYYELQGCPSGFVKRVGDCEGYLEVEQIYGAIPCNTDEFNAIVNQLKGGIFP